MYAIVDIKGKQFKVEKGQELKVPKINGKIGSKIEFDNGIISNDGGKISINKPIKIVAKILSHGKDKKIVVFKFKRRKGYQKKNGHKQEYTLIQINDLNLKGKKTVPKKASPPKKKTTAAKSIKKNAPKKTVKKKATTKQTKNKD